MMVQAALSRTTPDWIMTLDQIAATLATLGGGNA
jgi:hypothetical protein